MEAQAGEEPARRRSMARTWGGVALIGVGLIMPVQHEVCLVSLFGSTCVKETYTPGVIGAVGLIGAGVMLATIWSDVPANSVGFFPLPGGGRLSTAPYRHRRRRPAHSDERHEASIRVMRKLGMEFDRNARIGGMSCRVYRIDCRDWSRQS